MKRVSLKDEQSRFSGGVRHYHRTGAPVQRSWDEWVDGAGKKRGGGLRLLKLLGVLIAIVALGAIVAGLFIELR